MREKSAYLLNLPKGSMEPSSWNTAGDTLKWWISQHTEESVDASINLVKRFVNETLVDGSESVHLARFLDKTVMAELVENWYAVWKGSRSAWTPFRFFKVVDYFNRAIPHLESFGITIPTVSCIINGLQIRSNPSDAAETADKIIHYYFENPGTLRRPDTSRFLITTCLNLWNSSGRSDAVERAEITFMSLRELDPEILDVEVYNAMFHVYSQAGKIEKAEALIETMAIESLQDRRFARPNTTSIATMVLAWMRSGHPDAPEQAAQFLRRLKEPLDPLGRQEISPDTQVFNSLLCVWASSGQKDAPKQAYELIKVMEDLGFHGAKPDYVSYAIVADAFGKSGDPRSSGMILDELCARYQTEKQESLAPALHMFLNLIDAWMRSNETQKGQKVWEVVDQMRKLHKNGILCKAPGSFLYNQVLSTIVSTNQTDKAKLADDCLQKMKVAHQSGDLEVGPNSWSYSFVICAYLETPSGLERAQELLTEACLDGVPLNAQTVGHLIKSLIQAGNVNGADIWMHRIFDAIEEGSLVREEKPSEVLLLRVLNAWFQVASGDKNATFRASKLVRRMYELKEKGLLCHPQDQIWLIDV